MKLSVKFENDIIRLMFDQAITIKQRGRFMQVAEQILVMVEKELSEQTKND